MKKAVAVVLEIIPVICAIASIVLTFVLPESVIAPAMVNKFNCVLMPLAFLGFVFFFIGRKLAKEEKAVRVLGILDWVASFSIILVFVAAIFAFGL